jgi:hypothetical protein
VDQDADICRVDLGDFPHSHVFRALTGPTLADNERHTIARVALLQRLINDPRVSALYAEWERRIGLDEALPLWRRAVDIAEASTGRLWFEISAAEITVESEQDAEALELGQDAMLGAASRVRGALHGRTVNEVRKVIDSMGTQLRQWPWLVEELVRAFWLRFYGYLYGGKIVDRRWSGPCDPPAGRADLSFAVQSGETVSTALARLIEEIERTFTAISPPDHPTVPPGRSVSEFERDRIERDVEWYYRVRIKHPGDSVRRIAGEIGDKNESRRSVYDGLKRAVTLLGWGYTVALEGDT